MSNNSLSIDQLESDYHSARMEIELNIIKNREDDTFHERMQGHFATLRSIAQEAQRQASRSQPIEGEVMQ